MELFSALKKEYSEGSFVSRGNNLRSLQRLNREVKTLRSEINYEKAAAMVCDRRSNKGSKMKFPHDN